MAKPVQATKMTKDFNKTYNMTKYCIGRIDKAFPFNNFFFSKTWKTIEFRCIHIGFNTKNTLVRLKKKETLDRTRESFFFFFSFSSSLTPSFSLVSYPNHRKLSLPNHVNVGHHVYLISVSLIINSAIYLFISRTTNSCWPQC